MRQLDRLTGICPDILFREKLIKMRFLSWHIEDGSVPFMLFSAKCSPVTAPEMHWISGQSHGDDVEVHEASEEGLPQCSFKLIRIVCSKEV